MKTSMNRFALALVCCFAPASVAWAQTPTPMPAWAGSVCPVAHERLASAANEEPGADGVSGDFLDAIASYSDCADASKISGDQLEWVHLMKAFAYMGAGAARRVSDPKLASGMFGAAELEIEIQSSNPQLKLWAKKARATLAAARKGNSIEWKTILNP